ncbi:response regulator transcription factor [Agromyces aerolatus]|uniref:response regulator transcription factor n=1 Tax=Agromyces sp. LY-1074 TaxID=3074080 RepID=UPI0028541D4C|nr:MULTISPECIES: response regulator transcription factor [unclassified Agromyces]MDR5700155.1 response regulator transcription factor [Agromyces sp. LY-1074]MDR5706477.1 response regulator transcription factor [Agromyces sp. LY-1358]
MTRVVIVDDQALIRQGIAGLLAVAGIEVVGEADDGRTALELIATTDPDVVILDMRMPRFDGVWTLQELQRLGSEIPVLVLTTFDDDLLVLDALRAGARGYLLKDVTLEQLTHAVDTLAEGGTLIAPALTDRLLRAIRSGPSPVAADAPAAQPLTDRELDVLRLIASGYPNRQIADALFIAEGTVKNHISVILTKLSARDRTNAVLRALHEGILS